MASFGGATKILITEKIIILVKNKNLDLADFKFYCFDGQPLFCQVIKNRSEEETVDFFDMNWVHQNFTGLGLPLKPHCKNPIECPTSFEKMKDLVGKLAVNKKFVRIDFYEVNTRPYFGEITFFPASGFGKFAPESINYEFGKAIHI